MFKFIRILFFTACFSLIAIYLFLSFVDLNHFKQPIANEISFALNRRVGVEDLSLKMSLSPTLQVRNISVHNSEDFDENTFLGQVELVDVGFKILPLFKGVLEVDSVSLKGIKVNLIEKNGKKNWALFEEKPVSQPVVASSKEEQGVRSANKFNLDRIKIDQINVKNALISYSKDGKQKELQVLNVSLSQMKNLFAQMMYDKKPIEINFSNETLFKDLQNDCLKEFTFNLTTHGVLAKISGTVGVLSTLSNLNLRADVSSNDLNKTVSLFLNKPAPLIVSKEKATAVFELQGAIDNFKISNFKASVENESSLQFVLVAQNLFEQPQVSFDGNFEFKSADLMKKYDMQPVGSTFKGSFKNDKLTIDKMTLFVNKSDIQLEGILDLGGAIPDLKANIYSSYFDVADILIEKSVFSSSVQKVEQNIVQPVEKKIDFSALKKLNADLNVAFSNLKLDFLDKEYHKGTLKIVLKDGLLNVNPIQFNLLGGEVSGLLKVDAKQSLPKLYTDIQATGVELSSIEELSAYLKNTPTNLKLNLQATGDTKQAILSSLTGDIDGEILSGQFMNKWMNSLPVLIGVVTKSNAFSYTGTNNQTKIDCLAAHLKIKDGIIHSDENIALETSAINLVISGDINLVKQDLSLSVLPSLNQLSGKTNKNISYMQYVRVQGPFSQIKIQEDVKGALTNLVQNKAEKAIQKLVDLPKEEVQTQEIGDLCKIAQGKKSKTDLKKKEKQQTLKDAVETKVKEELQNKISEAALKLLKK